MYAYSGINQDSRDMENSLDNLFSYIIQSFLSFAYSIIFFFFFHFLFSNIFSFLLFYKTVIRRRFAKTTRLSKSERIWEVTKHLPFRFLLRLQENRINPELGLCKRKLLKQLHLTDNIKRKGCLLLRIFLA